MKRVIIASVLTTLTFAIKAQNLIGIRIGSAWNNVAAPAFNGTVDFQNFRSGTYGLVAEMPITNNFSFQPEVNYTSKGFRLNTGTDLKLFNVNLPVGATAVTNIRYIDVPLTGKYSFGTEGVRAYVMAGPTVGYALSGNLETRAKVIIDFRVASTPINLETVNYRRFEVGGVVGAGFEVPFLNGKIFADARYTRGFKEVYEVPVVGARVTNTGFNIGAGYKFTLNQTGNVKNKTRA